MEVRGATVTFLGGVNEIGGNKILVEDGPDRVLFDFGPSFAPKWEDYYYNFLKPRTTSPVKDLLEFDLIPRIGGLYSKEALADSDLPYRAPEVHAIFITHAHADHAGHLDLVDPEIPVYVGEGTKTLLDAIAGSTAMKYGDHAWRTFADRAPVRVGGIEVVPFPVDHSVPFAYGFLIRTSSGTLAYTGDIRHHGPRADDTHAFLTAAAAERPAGLLIEGTRAGPDARRNLTEQGVRSEVDRLLEHHAGLALACTYPRDVDRLTTLDAAARAVGRRLVVSARTAYLLNAIAPRWSAGTLPLPGTPDGVLVYNRKKKIFREYEKPYLEAALTSEDVRQHGAQYLLALDPYHFPELIDLRPPRGTPFIHSMSEPFSEDDVDDRVMHNWLDHFGLEFHQMHASGHASATELFEIAHTVKPSVVYPIHTEHPEAFEKLGPGVHPPRLGVAYPVAP